MRRAIAVIGANFGDEGKGLATDFLVDKYADGSYTPLVVRGNGGAQAGHTVVTDKARHVFGHIGSGTFAGASTYLASNFIINLDSLTRELKVVEEGLACPAEIIASGDCRVTTIYDMALNSLLELSRGMARHGSCGLGINETVTRHRAGYFLDLNSFYSGYPHESLRRCLSSIKLAWVPERLSALQLTPAVFANVGEDVQRRANLYFKLLDMDAEEVATRMETAMRHNIALADPKRHCMQDCNIPVIIEGAQGLMLDEYLGTFPYVTRSITGLPSSIRAAHECDQTTVKPVYITRAYTTRHGAGPLEFDDIKPTDNELSDNTNVENPWQGKLRYAPLNLQRMREFIKKDIERGVHVSQAFSIDVEAPEIFLTCMDQVSETITIIDGNGQPTRIKATLLPELLETTLECKVAFISRGPKRSDVEDRTPTPYKFRHL